jgi:hypothetical protein
MLMKNSNDTIGNRTRDLPACSEVPQPTAPTRAINLKNGVKSDELPCRALRNITVRAGLSGDRIPVGGEISAPVQTGPGACPASYTMGIGSFPAVKRPGCGVNHSPPSSAEVKERVELYLYSSFGSSWPVIG